MQEVEVTEKKKTYLENRKVKLVAINRKNWLPTGHDGEFMFTGCVQSFCLPFDIKNGRLYKILTPEEQEFFEKKLYLKEGDLSIYKKTDNYWHTFRIRVDKEGLFLDLSDPIDNLKYRVLKASPVIAPSWDERFNSGEYKFALVDEQEQTVARSKITDKKKKAYKFLGQIEGSHQKMYDFLRVVGKKPSKSSTREWLNTEIDKLIEDPQTLELVLKTIEDSTYEMKLFIEDAVEAGLIRKPSKAKYLIVGLDDEFTQPDLINFLNPEGKNQDLYLKIKNQLESK